MAKDKIDAFIPTRRKRKKGNILDMCIFTTSYKVDLATVMAEMFKIGDRNNDDVLTR